MVVWDTAQCRLLPCLSEGYLGGGVSGDSVEPRRLKRWDIITRWIGLRVLEIPFPRTSILNCVRRSIPSDPPSPPLQGNQPDTDKNTHSFFHSLQLAMQLQDEERREQQQRQQQQQQRSQSRPHPARGSPSRSNIPPQSQQQSSNSNQHGAESPTVRESKVKFIKLCARNFRPISNFLGIFPKYSTPCYKGFHWQGNWETVLESVKFDFLFLNHLSTRITQSKHIHEKCNSQSLQKCSWMQIWLPHTVHCAITIFLGAFVCHVPKLYCVYCSPKWP